jgi:heptaprenyl diphosphate synthase
MSLHDNCRDADTIISTNKEIKLKPTLKPTLALKAIFLSIALIVGFIERLIPFDFVVPGVKPGLANVMVLSAIYLFPWHVALEISILKCITVGVFAGMGMSFFYSLTGALLSYAVMIPMTRIGNGRVSPIGVSVCGAVLHNLGQILVASVIMRTLMIAAYLPVLLLSGVVTGVIVGIIVNILVNYTRNIFLV